MHEINYSLALKRSKGILIMKNQLELSTDRMWDFPVAPLAAQTRPGMSHRGRFIKSPPRSVSWISLNFLSD